MDIYCTLNYYLIIYSISQHNTVKAYTNSNFGVRVEIYLPLGKNYGLLTLNARTRKQMKTMRIFSSRKMTKKLTSIVRRMIKHSTELKAAIQVKVSRGSLTILLLLQ